MEKTGGSRLLQMQARFQQKQMQERELKIASLYEAQQARALDRVRQSPSSVQVASPPQHQPGKVRQMFEERRTKGIDKSYPLQPIHNTDRPAQRKPLPNGYTKVTSTASTSSTTTRVAEKRTTTKTKSVTNGMKVTQKIHHKNDNISKGHGDINHNHVENIKPVKKTRSEIVQDHSRLNGNLPNSNRIISDTPAASEDKADGYLLEDETFPDALEPAVTPRSPEPEPPRPPRKNTSTKSNSLNKPNSQPNTPTAPPRKAPVDKTMTKTSRQYVPSSPSIKSQRIPSATSAAATVEGSPCSVCGRRFATDRLAKHEEICKKAHAKKRKPFDVLKHRLAGTEAEPFINKLRRKQTQPQQNESKVLNSTWRQKHQDFIKAIRAAKEVQAHLNKGGKLSDLPPPPPSENPDYVPCPHCGRRFNQAAAERHIPKCASYQFNKPKAPPKKR